MGLHLEFKRAVWVFEAAMTGLIVEHEVWLYSNAKSEMLAGMRQTFQFWIAEHTILELGCFKARVYYSSYLLCTFDLMIKSSLMLENTSLM